MNRLLSTIALIGLIAFLGVYLWKVPRLDLGLVLVITILMACLDFWREAWRPHFRK